MLMPLILVPARLTGTHIPTKGPRATWGSGGMGSAEGAAEGGEDVLMRTGSLASQLTSAPPAPTPTPHLPPARATPLLPLVASVDHRSTRVRCGADGQPGGKGRAACASDQAGWAPVDAGSAAPHHRHGPTSYRDPRRECWTWSWEGMVRSGVRVSPPSRAPRCRCVLAATTRRPDAHWHSVPSPWSGPYPLLLHGTADSSCSNGKWPRRVGSGWVGGGGYTGARDRMERAATAAAVGRDGPARAGGASAAAVVFLASLVISRAPCRGEEMPAARASASRAPTATALTLSTIWMR